MSRLALPALFIGLALAVAVVAWQGFGDVAKALSEAGFRLLWLVPLFLIPLLLSGLAWSVIFPAGNRPSLQRLCLASWIAVSINWLLPVAQIGGEVAKAVWLARRAAPAPMMVATAIVDKVLQTAGQAFVALIGVGLVLVLASDSAVVPGAVLFAVLLLALIPAFFLAQRRGLLLRLVAAGERVFMKHLKGREAGGLVERLGGLDAALSAVGAAPGRLFAHLVIRLVSRLVLAAEVWLALALLGHPVSVLEALMIECLAQTLRSAAFAVPGAYGVQEGGFVLLGALVGVPAEVALSVSLAKRMRELLVGLPGLLFYQISEGRLALAAR
ncbi:flippase-like domain-containing protein [Pelagibius sp.]|uniref:flippase-like domain-containing protein n=1 Tax=Pelagibius sp. TaxID=1931238 RepID=UPI003BB14F12